VQEQGRHGEGEHHVLDHVRAEEVVVREIVNGSRERDEQHAERPGERHCLMRGQPRFGIEPPA
jgi:hypothetical protein